MRIARLLETWLPMALAGWMFFCGGGTPGGLFAAGKPTPSKTESAAAKAWDDLLAAGQTPALPPSWSEKTPTPQDIARFESGNAKQAGRAALLARDFYRRFPQHENAKDARIKEFIHLSIAAELSDARLAGELAKLRETLANDKSLTEDDRFAMNAGTVERMVDLLDYKVNPVNLETMEKQVRNLQRDFPKRAEVFDYWLALVKNCLYYGRYDQARRLAQELQREVPAPKEYQEAARGMLKKLDRLGKPLTIQFTAVDGRPVDLEQMRGKVVLIDFWATWCPPCMRELPHLKAAYTKWHARGFEILGISADQDKEDLLQVLSSKKIPWPQFFDGRGEESQWVQAFEALPLPMMWLVDKQGILRDLSAQMDLEDKIKKLLAAGP